MSKLAFPAIVCGLLSASLPATVSGPAGPLDGTWTLTPAFSTTCTAGVVSVEVTVGRVDGGISVEICDDGVGGADSEQGSGLRGLADRVEALGGRLRVWTPRGGGTRVRAEIPCG